MVVNRKPKSVQPGSRPNKKTRRARKRTITKSTTTTRRKPASIRGEPTSTPAANGPESKSNGEHDHLLGGYTTQCLPRPARFWPNAGHHFCVLESIALLQAGFTPDNFEKIGWIHDISQNLSSARFSAETYGDWIVPQEQLNLLSDLLEEFKQENANNIRLAILSLGRRPLMANLDAETLQGWYRPILEILQLSKDFAEEQGFEKDWIQVSEKTRARWLTECQRLAENGESVSCDLSIPELRRTFRPLPNCEPLQLHPLPDNSRKAGVVAVAQEILAWYRRFSSINITADWAFFLGDVQTIADRLSILLKPGLNGKESLWSSCIDPNTQVLIESWCQRFKFLWKRPAQAALEQKFQSLAQLVSTTDKTFSEEEFQLLHRDLELLHSPPPNDVAPQHWHKFSPGMLDDLQAAGARVRIIHLYASYQEQTYPTDEKSRLWLLIWKSLKAIYFLLRARNFTFPEDTDTGFRDRYSVDTLFFNDGRIRALFERILGADEASSGHLIEDLVATYCLHVSNCRKHAYQHYFQFGKLADSQIHESILGEVEEYHRDPQWNPNQHVHLQRMAFRLNRLLGGTGNILRRNTTETSGTAWAVFELDYSTDNKSSDVAPQKSSVNSNCQQFLTSGPRLETNDVTENVTVEPQGSGRDDGHHPDELTLPSALSYVRMPFSDTRATQVMESRQFAREIADSNVHSDGPQESDIVNIPPRHVTLSPPANSSLGPLSLLQRLSSRRLPPRQRLAQIPGPLPSRSVLAPILDPNNRVVKSPREERGLRRRVTGPSSPASPHSDPTNEDTGSADQGLAPLIPGQVASSATSRFRRTPTALQYWPIYEDETSTGVGMSPNYGPPESLSLSNGGSSPPRRPLFQPAAPLPHPDEAIESIEQEESIEQLRLRPGEWRNLCHPCPSSRGGGCKGWHHMCDSTCPNLRAALRRYNAQPPANSSSSPVKSNKDSNQENRPPPLRPSADTGPSYSSITDNGNGQAVPMTTIEQIHMNPRSYAAGPRSGEATGRHNRNGEPHRTFPRGSAPPRLARQPISHLLRFDLRPSDPVSDYGNGECRDEGERESICDCGNNDDSDPCSCECHCRCGGGNGGDCRCGHGCQCLCNVRHACSSPSRGFVQPRGPTPIRQVRSIGQASENAREDDVERASLGTREDFENSQSDVDYYPVALNVQSELNELEGVIATSAEEIYAVQVVRAMVFRKTPKGPPPDLERERRGRALDEFGTLAVTEQQRMAIRVLRALHDRRRATGTDPPVSTAAQPERLVTPPAAAVMPTGHALPTRDDYEMMTIVELHAELDHRGVARAEIKRLRKAALVDRLMAEDQKGNRGRGACGRRPNAIRQRGEDPGTKTRRKRKR